jgi:hypothetical protein
MIHLFQDQYQIVQNNMLVQEYEVMEIVMLHHQVLRYDHLSIFQMNILNDKINEITSKSGFCSSAKICSESCAGRSRNVSC